MAGFKNRFRRLGGLDSVMADSLNLILQVCQTPGDNAEELAGWLRGELLDLDLQRIDLLPGKAVSSDGIGSADIASLLLVQMDPKALQVVLAKVADWMALSGRVVEISTGGHTLKLGRPTSQQEEAIDGSLVSGAEVIRVQPEGETEAVIEVTPSVVPNCKSPAPEPGKALVPLRPRESLPVLQDRMRIYRRNLAADTRLLVKGSVNIEALSGREFRYTAVFTGISSLFGGGFAVLLVIVILAVTKHYRGFSVSTSYPIHRIYQGVVHYFVHITPPPGSPHILVVYTVYLAVLPVLFAVVFMHLKVGSARLIVATMGCVIFMLAPFVIAITSIRVGSTNCGSWNYPELNSGSGCYNALTIAFRVAFIVGIIGLVVPIIYLIRGRRDGHKNGLLLGTLILCANFVTAIFRFITGQARRQARGDRDVAADQDPVEAIVGKHLLPHERKVIIVRRHPALLIGPIVLVFAWPVAAGLLTTTVLNGNKPLVTLVWIAWLVIVVRMIWKIANWIGTFFVVTSARMLLISGVLARKVEMLPLAKVTDMSFRRSFIGRLLGFGEFIIESAGSNQPMQTVGHIPYPEQLYIEICGLIFKDPGSGDD